MKKYQFYTLCAVLLEINSNLEAQGTNRLITSLLAAFFAVVAAVNGIRET